jgi:hypothetical protein
MKGLHSRTPIIHPSTIKENENWWQGLWTLLNTVAWYYLIVCLKYFRGEGCGLLYIPPPNGTMTWAGNTFEYGGLAGWLLPPCKPKVLSLSRWPAHYSSYKLTSICHPLNILTPPAPIPTSPSCSMRSLSFDRFWKGKAYSLHFVPSPSGATSVWVFRILA